MSTPASARRLAFEAARRRVAEELRPPSTDRTPSAGRQITVLVAASALFVLAFAARLAIDDPAALIANFYIVPIALLAIEFGLRAGLAAAAVALGLVFAWGAIEVVHVDALGYTSRGAAFLVTGGIVGRFSDRLRQDIAARQHAQRHLSLYADQLERANQHLAQSVEQLEAYASIARAVGGETELERVLALILARGREIVRARALIVWLPSGEELVAATEDDSGRAPPQRVPLHGSLAGEALLGRVAVRATAADEPVRLAQLSPGAQAAILVPLTFRGEAIGVLAGIDQVDRPAFDADDEQLLESVAASAATAVATARTVAAERLRLSLEAAEQARGRWARELHDETLQGLIGARMVLSAGLARAELEPLLRAVETADEHLGAEVRRLRNLIAELRPAALDDLGLGPAIESLAKRQAAIGGFAVAAELGLGLSGDERLPRDTEVAVYRIVQEALSNAVRHAAAAQVSVRVAKLADRIEITVHDDGRGFDPGAVGEGLGLTGMRERAMLAGGLLTVSSRAGGPTSVSAMLPVVS